MEKEERLTKQIKTVYTEIAKRLVDPSFSFPEGGQAKRQLSKFIVNFTQICGGEFNTSRLVDYCVFQLHKNRNAQYQRTLAPKTFGTTALQKYLSMSSKSKQYLEDQWLSEANLTRTSINKQDTEHTESAETLSISISQISSKLDSLYQRVNELSKSSGKTIELNWWDLHKDKIYLSAIITMLITIFLVKIKNHIIYNNHLYSKRLFLIKH